MTLKGKQVTWAQVTETPPICEYCTYCKTCPEANIHSITCPIDEFVEDTSETDLEVDDYESNFDQTTM